MLSTDQILTEYERRIHATCVLNMQDHEDMLLCWGMMGAVKQGREMNCTKCEFYNRDYIKSENAS